MGGPRLGAFLVVALLCLSSTGLSAQQGTGVDILRVLAGDCIALELPSFVTTAVPNRSSPTNRGASRCPFLLRRSR